MLNKERPTTFYHLVKTLWRRHRGLDGQGSDVLPSLLQERNEVVDGQHDVRDQLILGHAHVSDSDTHAEHLLQLELDGGLDFIDLLLELFVVGDWGGEFTSCKSPTLAFVQICGMPKQRNIPFERPGPKRRGICLIKVSEATKASYLRASFLISFLFLLSFFKSSEDMASTPACLARSISCWSPRTLYTYQFTVLLLFV